MIILADADGPHQLKQSHARSGSLGHTKVPKQFQILIVISSSFCCLVTILYPLSPQPLSANFDGSLIIQRLLWRGEERVSCADKGRGRLVSKVLKQFPASSQYLKNDIWLARGQSKNLFQRISDDITLFHLCMLGNLEVCRSSMILLLQFRSQYMFYISKIFTPFNWFTVRHENHLDH